MTEKFLSQDEIDMLLTGMSDDEVQETPSLTLDPSEARAYNLATQERIVRGRLPSLELINERFARQLHINLFSFLHRSAEVSVGPIRTTKYSEFLRHLVVPTNLNLINIKPLQGKALVVLDPFLVFQLVDFFFGGDGSIQTRIEGRNFSQTEQRIIQRVLNIILETLSKAWEFIYSVEFEYVRSELNPQFANIASPNEVVVATTFRIDLGGQIGEMHLCIPYSMIEPIRDLLRYSMNSESFTHDQRWANMLHSQIQFAQVEVVADLCSMPSTLRNILKMEVGDIIPLSITDLIELKADNIPIMECSYGKLNGQYALRVEHLNNSTAEAAQGVEND
jgi:flagellar motor switch protein FliM